MACFFDENVEFDEISKWMLNECKEQKTQRETFLFEKEEVEKKNESTSNVATKIFVRG